MQCGTSFPKLYGFVSRPPFPKWIALSGWDRRHALEPDIDGSQLGWGARRLVAALASKIYRRSDPNNARVRYGAPAARIRDIAPRMPDVLEVRLERPAGFDFIGVADLEQRLIRARNRQMRVEVERMHAVRNACVGEADSERMGRSVRNHAGECHAALCASTPTS
jgi:hypothetical protein